MKFHLLLMICKVLFQTEIKLSLPSTWWSRVNTPSVIICFRNFSCSSCNLCRAMHAFVNFGNLRYCRMSGKRGSILKVAIGVVIPCFLLSRRYYIVIIVLKRMEEHLESLTDGEQHWSHQHSALYFDQWTLLAVFKHLDHTDLCLFSYSWILAKWF